MAGAALMASFHKGEERVILEWRGIGGLKVRLIFLQAYVTILVHAIWLIPYWLNQAINVHAMRAGEIRGYVSDPKFYMPATSFLGFAMKAGTLTVTKVPSLISHKRQPGAALTSFIRFAVFI
jgi:hypothetical protein